MNRLHARRSGRLPHPPRMSCGRPPPCGALQLRARDEARRLPTRYPHPHAPRDLPGYRVPAPRVSTDPPTDDDDEIPLPFDLANNTAPTWPAAWYHMDVSTRVEDPREGRPSRVCRCATAQGCAATEPPAPDQRGDDVKFRVERDVLADAVTWVARGLPARPPVPVLAGVLLVADAEGTITLSAFDYEVSAKITIPADVDEPGTVLVLGRLLARHLPQPALPARSRWPRPATRSR